MARASESPRRTASPLFDVPPGSRTIGQSIGAAIRAYGDNFWKALALGLAPVLPGAAGYAVYRAGAALVLVVPLVGVLVDVAMTLAFALAVAVVARTRPTRRRAGVAVAAGLTALLPAHLVVVVAGLLGGIVVGLLALVVLAPVWLALLGMSVPAAVAEGLGYRSSLQRARALAQADFRHLWGAMTTLAITWLAGFLMLLMLLVNTSQMNADIAQPLTAVVMLPLLLFGGAVLYQDQLAREQPAVPVDRASAVEPSSRGGAA
jgi:hypothetical protein